MARIHLSENFTYKKLLRFVAPSVISLVFASLYGIVDGFFVSNFVGELQFAGLNLIFPLIMILGAVGFMIGTGGNAVVSKVLGEKDTEKANRIFSMLIYLSLGIGIVLGLVGILLARPVAELFARAEQDLSPEQKAELIDHCVLYSRILLAALPTFMLQNVFQGFFVTAEKARLGLLVTVAAGTGNIVFDALFIVGFDWGLAGAAIATALNQVIGGVVPLIYFGRKNGSLLRLGKTRFDGKVFIKVCYNGMSEFFTNISISVVAIVYNTQLMKYIGIDGVTAYGVVQYVGFIFISVFLGYAMGSSPIVGYDYGAQDKEKLKNVLKKSLVLTGICGLVMAGISAVFAKPFCSIFVGKSDIVLPIAVKGVQFTAISFLLCGFNIFASAFFTSLSNGTVSLVISFSRMFVFQIGAVLLLPVFFGENGIWSAVIVAEAITLLFTGIFLITQRKKYGYL